MPYCQKCGNKVDETMTFCPRCGSSLKEQFASQAPAPPPTYRRRDEKNEKKEKNEKQEPEKGEKQEKGEHRYIGFLIGGLVLIVIGLFSLLRSQGYFASVPETAILLLVIGVIIIIAAVYLSSMARKRFPPPA
jgi:uncharacterized membrane protein YvbJ